MKYLKLIDDWSDRYYFLEAAPPHTFVLMSADCQHIMYKGENDKTIVNNGQTYNFIHAATNVDEQQAIISFDSALPQDVILNADWTVTVGETGAVLHTATIVRCNKGDENKNIPAPTTIRYNGVEYDVSNVEKFVIKGHQYTYAGEVIVMTTS